MRSSRISIFLLIVGCAWIVAQQAQSPSTKTKAATPAVTLTEADNGKDIDLTAGTTLIVKLASNPSTGYKWTLVGEPSPLKLQKTSFRQSTSKPGVAGAPGIDVFQLSTNSAGMATLTLVYRRSWEYNVPPVKTFTVRVDVR